LSSSILLSVQHPLPSRILHAIIVHKPILSEGGRIGDYICEATLINA
jgi:hypothetical protein